MERTAYRIELDSLSYFVSSAREEARVWYVLQAAEQNWSSRVLEGQIGTLFYERLLLSRDKAAVTEETQHNIAKVESAARAFVRDPVMLEFLGLPASGKLLGSSLEEGLMDKLQSFLL